MFVKNIAKKLKLNLNQIEDRGIIEAHQMGVTIPKIIHQVYFNYNSMPVEIQENIAKLKQLNTDWEYKLYDDNDIQNFITANFPHILKYYNKINPKYGAAKADLFRYLLMYKVGGVYLDIKSTISRPLNEIIQSDDQYILGNWIFSHNPVSRHSCIDNPNGEFQQWHIICVKGHPFLKATIENVCKNIDLYNPLYHDVGMMGVLRVTGPIAYTLSILPIQHLYRNRVGFDMDLGLVYSVFSNNLDAHKPLFKTHYHSLEESVVAQPRLIQLFFPIIRRLKNKLKNKAFN